MITHNYQRLGKTAAYMLLSKVNYACVGAAEVAGQLLYKEHGYIIVCLDQMIDNCQRQRAYNRRLDGHSARHITLFGKVGSIAEILHRPHKPQYLDSASDAFFDFFNLALKKAPKTFRILTFKIDILIFLKIMNFKTISHEPFLIAVKNRPYCGHIFVNYFFKS
jgi:hypothetical protein